MTFREENIHWIENVNPLHLTVLGDENIMTTTPYRDQTGKRMLIYRFGNWKPSKIPVDEIFKGMKNKTSRIVIEIKCVFVFSYINCSRNWNYGTSRSSQWRSWNF
jgi:hypothetical protein